VVHCKLADHINQLTIKLEPNPQDLDLALREIFGRMAQTGGWDQLTDKQVVRITKHVFDHLMEVIEGRVICTLFQYTVDYFGIDLLRQAQLSQELMLEDMVEELTEEFATPVSVTFNPNDPVH
jgi:hypothetical protein